jgi:1-hydroxycarotenoid 3,4-desaturase
MAAPQLAVIGGGIAGMVAALELRQRGFGVTLLERAMSVGGKLRQLGVHGVPVDAGPTVFTLRPLFEQIFEAAGSRLEAHVTLRPLEILARHAWIEGGELDLYADLGRSADAIARFAGARDAEGYRRFCADARRVFSTLEHGFLYRSQPSLSALLGAAGVGGLARLWQLRPFTTLWSALGDYFQDPRLRQLFARYATYCGSSPFDAPATLMLVAHVEQRGVWQLEGGMRALADALLGLLRAREVNVRSGCTVRAIRLARGRVARLELAEGEELPIDAVIVTSDAGALAAGFYGPEVASGASPVPRASRSLSAITWALHAPTRGFVLSHHNVFFSADYRAEFDALRAQRMPSAPTVYLCAQDRSDAGTPAPLGAERLFCLINAPAIGDLHRFGHEETRKCLATTLSMLRACGLELMPCPCEPVATTPTEFHHLFPGSGGALYGQATHGWRSSFTRPGARTSIPGLYLAGGSAHPGPGLPMAALSARHAAACLNQDLASNGRLRPAAMPGGISMR